MIQNLQGFIALMVFVLINGFSSTSLALPKTTQGFDYISKSKKELTLQGKLTVVVFLSSKCPCSNSHVEHLKALSEKYKKNVQFVGVHSNQDETQEKGQAYFTEKQIAFPVLRDDQATIADVFGALKTPHVFVVGKDGNVIYSGPVSDASEFPKSERHYLDEFLESQIQGKPFEAVQRKPLGCFIGRKKI
jgi:peroxiredoxin